MTTRTDPRIGRTRRLVLQQARQLISEQGPAAVTYSELASRAGVTRQTLYRHWPTREALFVDLALEGAAAGMPDAGGPPEQVLTEFLRGMRTGMRDASNAAPLTALLAQADHDPDSSRALRQIVTDVRAALNVVLRDSAVTLDAEQYARLCGPLLFQRFFARRPVTDAFIERLAAEVTAASPRRPGRPRVRHR